MSKEASNFFNKFTNDLVGGLNTIAIGKIAKFDGVKMMADVEVLPDGALVVDVPVATLQTGEFYIRVPHKKGDHVLIGFAQRDIDGIMHGGDATPSQRMLSLDDAVVISGINIFSKSLPSADAGKLAIGQKDGAARITIDNGNINITGNVFVNGTALVAGGSSF